MIVCVLDTFSPTKQNMTKLPMIIFTIKMLSATNLDQKNEPVLYQPIEKYQGYLFEIDLVNFANHLRLRYSTSKMLTSVVYPWH